MTCSTCYNFFISVLDLTTLFERVYTSSSNDFNQQELNKVKHLENVTFIKIYEDISKYKKHNEIQKVRYFAFLFLGYKKLFIKKKLVCFQEKILFSK